MRKKLFSSVAFLVFAFLLAITPVFTKAPEAQSNLNDWTPPLNISNSGSTQDPQIFQDFEGVFHIVWKDKFNGYFYVESEDGKNWSKPIRVIFPFTLDDNAPSFVSDSNGFIHAFWTNNQNVLSYSRVTSSNFGIAGSWLGKIDLAESAMSFDAAISQSGVLNLTYVRGISTDLFPAGVYYKQSKDNGLSWSESNLLYESGYLRSTSADHANVHLATSSQNGTDNIYIVWDNFNLRSVFFTKSLDAGQNWISPQILRGPDAKDGKSIPMFINIASTNESVLVTWQLSHENSACEIYSQQSADIGGNWSDPVSIPQIHSACTKSNTLYLLKNDLVIFLINIGIGNTMAVWDGSQWSNTQNVISSYINPTTRDTIIFKGQQIAVDKNGEAFYEVSYDEGIGGDVWLSTLSLASIQDWFPLSGQWSNPVVISSKVNQLSSISLICGEKQTPHLFWLQNDTSPTSVKSAIMYSSWDGQAWLQPIEIVTADNNLILSFNAVADRGKIFLVWEIGVTGQVFFSLVDETEALLPSAWSDPVQLTQDQAGGSSPNISVGNQGNIYVTYTVPVNDNRGVYFVKSEDSGINWSSSISLGSPTSDWNVIDKSSLYSISTNLLNMLWVEHPIDGRNGTAKIFSDMSLDNGKTWVEPKIVAEGDISWAKLYAVSGGVLHRFWQNMDQNHNYVTWHQFSVDGGISWNLPTNPFGVVSPFGASTVASDNKGNIYLFGIEKQSQLNFDIYTGIWNNETWLKNKSLFLGNNFGYPITNISACVTSSGALILIYSAKIIGTDTGMLEDAIFYSVNSSIPASVPSTTMDPQPTISPEIGNTPQATKPAPTPNNEDTPVTGAIEKTPTMASSPNKWSGLYVGAGVSIIIVVLFFVFILVIKKR